MFALRCFVWGTVIGIALAVVVRPRYEVRVVSMHHPPRPPLVIHDPPTVVDVAAGVAPTILPSLVKLARGEHVVAVDDRQVANDLEAGAVIANSAARGYIELDASTGRRIVLILH